MLQEPGTSPYDLQFNFLGFPVRVAWGFWIVAAILGWSMSNYIDAVYVQGEMDSPGAPLLLAIWIVGLFVSILVHETGHTLAMRYYGLNSRIVLYHFGGLAIPDSFGSWDGARQRRIGPREQIVISAAGPALQLILGIAAWLIGLSLGIYMFETENFDSLFGTSLAEKGQLPSSAVIMMFLHAIVFPSVFWAILNLAPILPLDGGQITRGVLMLSNIEQPTRTAFMVSVVAGGVIGLWFLTSGQPFAGIMFLIFAANNWQAMQSGGIGY